MTVGLMRGIDRWAGVPLCLLTAFLVKLSGRTRAILPEQPAAILVIKMFGMGSVLLSAPMISALRAHFPRARILYATFAPNGAILEQIDGVDTPLLIYPSSPAAFLRSTLSVLHTLRSIRPAVVFDLEFFSKFATALASLSGAPVRVAFALPTRWRSGNITHAIPLDHSTHVADQFLRQLSAIGIASHDDARPHTRLLPKPEALERLREKIDFPARRDDLICVNINAGATSRERRWAADRFMDVVALLHRESPRLRFLFTGSEDEHGYVEEALAARPDLRRATTNCAGRCDVEELIALLSVARLFLTNDSGPMHIAAATGTPVVALFGPESPKLYGPRGDARVIYRALGCSPCLSVYNAKLFRCPYDAQCMREIGVEEVYGAVREALAHAEAGSLPGGGGASLRA
jgi:ADP-heptose:LPS heptosyltransferase